MQPLTDHNKTLVTPATAEAILEEVTIEDGTFAPDGQPDVARNIIVTVTSATIDAGTITVTGTGVDGEIVSESFDLSSALSFTGTVMFATITSIVVADLANEDPADVFAIGTGVTVQIWNGKGVLVSVVVGTTLSAGSLQIIDNTTGTTTNVGELKSGIAANVYKYKASIGDGLRLVLNCAESILVIYYI